MIILLIVHIDKVEKTTEVAVDDFPVPLSVKIADLGNACWTVSCIVFLYTNLFSLTCSIITLLMIYKLDSIVAWRYY